MGANPSLSESSPTDGSRTTFFVREGRGTELRSNPGWASLFEGRVCMITAIRQMKIVRSVDSNGLASDSELKMSTNSKSVLHDRHRDRDGSTMMIMMSLSNTVFVVHSLFKFAKQKRPPNHDHSLLCRTPIMTTKALRDGCAIAYSYLLS